MDLNQLRTFLAIADTGGVARAAARLNLSQPAASRQIQVLEAELGVLLFDRIGRRDMRDDGLEDLSHVEGVRVALVVVDVAAGKCRLIQIPGENLLVDRQSIESIRVVLHHCSVIDLFE